MSKQQLSARLQYLTETNLLIAMGEWFCSLVQVSSFDIDTWLPGNNDRECRCQTSRDCLWVVDHRHLFFPASIGKLLIKSQLTFQVSNESSFFEIFMKMKQLPTSRENLVVGCCLMSLMRHPFPSEISLKVGLNKSWIIYWFSQRMTKMLIESVFECRQERSLTKIFRDYVTSAHTFSSHRFQIVPVADYQRHRQGTIVANEPKSN